MKRKWICAFTAITLCVTSAGHSEEFAEEFTENEECVIECDEMAPTDHGTCDDEEQESVMPGTFVSKEPEGKRDPEKMRRWQNLAIAAGAIAVAVTALVLVGQHDGHH